VRLAGDRAFDDPPFEPGDLVDLECSAGRSESNYRLYDETVLWCVGAVVEMRSLGLTLAEIEQLHDSYLKDPDRPPSARFARLVDRAEERIHAQIAAHRQTLGRIEAFRASHHA
jgi:MerR family copper efflux transcriptional regulator